jgi:hypothetical protein
MKRNQLNGCVISIDTFLGSIEHWDMALFDRENGLPNLYKIFMSNVVAAGVQDYVVPLPQTSVTAASILRSKSISPAVVHIDAAHEYEEVIRDAREYYSLLNAEGYLIGDDYHSTWPGVVRAAGDRDAQMDNPEA